MKAAERAERDRAVLERFLAGANYREIGADLGLNTPRVAEIVKRQLADSARRRLQLTDAALEIYQERFERLYQLQFAKADAGDQRAAEVCERMLARNARLYGLADEINPAPLPAPTSKLPVDGGEESEDPDELSRIRARRNSAS